MAVPAELQGCELSIPSHMERLPVALAGEHGPSADREADPGGPGRPALFVDLIPSLLQKSEALPPGCAFMSFVNVTGRMPPRTLVTHTHLRTYAHARAHTHLGTYTHACAHIHSALAHTCTHAHTHAHTDTCTRTYTRARARTCTQSCTHTLAHAHTRMHTLGRGSGGTPVRISINSAHACTAQDRWRHFPPTHLPCSRS